MPLPPLQIMLAVNDHRTGRPSGELEALEIIDTIIIESWRPVPCHVENGRLYLNGRFLRIPLLGYQHWVGNWCWDCATMRPLHAVRLIQHLRGCNWQVIEAESRLYNIYQYGRHIPCHFLARLSAKGAIT